MDIDEFLDSKSSEFNALFDLMDDDEQNLFINFIQREQFGGITIYDLIDETYYDSYNEISDKVKILITCSDYNSCYFIIKFLRLNQLSDEMFSVELNKTRIDLLITGNKELEVTSIISTYYARFPIPAYVINIGDVESKEIIIGDTVRIGKNYYNKNSEIYYNHDEESDILCITKNLSYTNLFDFDAKRVVYDNSLYFINYVSNKYDILVQSINFVSKSNNRNVTKSSLEVKVIEYINIVISEITELIKSINKNN